MKIDLKKEYLSVWNYIKGSKKFIWAVSGIFLVSFFLGFFLTTPEGISSKIFEFIQEILLKAEGLSQGQLINFIFFNNVQSSFFSMLFGIIFGIFPVFASLSNGYLLGFVAQMAVAEAGIGTLWRIFPHGIFELPAMFISFALGLRLGVSIFKIEKFRNNLISSLKTFLFVVVPLLVISAIVEGSLIFFGN